MIFNVQKCSIHDGEGIRTLVFFKGCPLHCKWCANPESQSYQKEIMEFPKNCIHCGICEKNCPQSAISLDGDEYIIDRGLCKKCFRCTDMCFAESKKIVGREMSAEELFKEVYKDRFFYQMNGGGVTFSGGEPLTHPDLLMETAKKCKAYGISTAMESCGVGNYEEFKKALPYIDSMFMDIKHIDPDKHTELTGQGNEKILENIRKIAAFGIPVTIRTPVVPGCNDSVENIMGIAEFIAQVPGIVEYELLPYHELGRNKYTALGKPYELDGVKPPSDESIEEKVAAANAILMPHGKCCFYTKNNTRQVITRAKSDPQILITKKVKTA